MRFYKVNNIEHSVYDPDDPVKELAIVSDWRKGKVGQWVKTDDDCVIQILRRGAMIAPKGKSRKKEYVGTCTGTFLVSDNVKMDSSRRINIYSFGGSKKSDDILEDRSILTKNEELFVTYLASGLDAGIAYMRAYPTKNPHYASMKAGKLIKTQRIRTAMKEELKPICEKLNIHPESVLGGIQHEATTAEKSDTRLKALFKLADILDLEDKNKTTVTQMAVGAFKGFTTKEIESIRPKEISESNE